LERIIVILQCTRSLRKFSPTLQHRYMEMTSYMTSSKMPLIQTKTDI